MLQVQEAGIQPSPRTALIFIYCNTVAQILVFLSSCCNPAIYGIFNQNYRTSQLSAMHASIDRDSFRVPIDPSCNLDL